MCVCANVLLCIMPKTNSNVKTISLGGQISLGKKYAGQQVLVEKIEEGYWTIKTSITIPTNEKWLWEEPFKSQLDTSLRETAKRYANGRQPKLITLEELETKYLGTQEKVSNAD